MTEYEKYQNDVIKHPDTYVSENRKFMEYEFIEPLTGYKCRLWREGFYRAYVMLDENHPMYFYNEKHDLIEIHGGLSTGGQLGQGIDFAHMYDYNPEKRESEKYKDEDYLKKLKYWTFEEVILEVTRLAVQLRYIK